MKTKLLVLFSVLLSMTLQAAAPWDGTIASSFAGGTGTSTDPYQITTPQQLAYLAQGVNANTLVTTAGMYFILTNDLDLNGLPWTPIGSSDTYSFKGRLDGKFHVIANLYVNLPTTSGVGLFGYTASPFINNLGIVGNSSVTGAGMAGGIVGRCYISATASGSGIGKCFSNAAVSTGTGDGSGGIVGDWRQSGGRTYTISNCYSTGNISGNNYVAGIVGKVETTGLTVTNSYSTGTMTATGIGALNGGIATIVTGAAPTVTNCYYNNGDGTNALSNFGTVQTSAQMQAAAFVTTLGSSYIADWTGSNSVNNGFPILKPSIYTRPVATAFTTTYGTASAAQTFLVSGSYLGADLIATAPTGFEVSSDGTNYAATATFSKSGSTGSASGTLYIRLNATATVSSTSYNSKNIVLSSTGISSVNITTSASGNNVTQATPTLSLASSSVNYTGLAQAATVNSSVPGTVSNILYNGSATAPTAIGTYPVIADFTPTDATNYASLTGASAGSFTINATKPDAPVIGTATAGNAQVSVAFTAPLNNGGSSILDYTVTPYIGTTAGTPVTGSGSPIVVTGLTNGTAYTFTVTARNTVGSSAASSASYSVTPDATTNISSTAIENARVSVIGKNVNFEASESIKDLQLFAISGQLVVSRNINYQAKQVSFDVQYAGIYLLIAHTAEGQLTQKIIVNQ